jgi:hypothetical protein
MSGITNLQTLLRDMSPHLRKQVYVFCTFSQARYGDHSHLYPLASFAEDEGLTLVLEQGVADAYKIPYETTLRCITLTVHSSLEAVGLTAAIASKLKDRNISANVIAAFFYDHVFVTADRADDAMQALKEFAVEQTNL